LQNLPRGLGTGTDAAFEALQTGSLPLLYDDAVGTVAEMLRGFFVGDLVVGDLAQIEARTLAWLAGQEDLLDVFRRKGDPYAVMAQRIYAKPQVSKDERFMGKQVVLGAGYGMGYEKFRRMLDETYDVQIDDAFALRVVGAYRSANPAIVSFWRKMEAAFGAAVTGRETRVGKLVVFPAKVAGRRYVCIRLPSGRWLWYAKPENLDGELRHHGRNIYAGGRWESVSTYGGKLAENVTQAVARDVLAEAMLRLDAKYRLVLTVHDEIVAEGTDSLDAFKAEMLVCPAWAEGLPLDAEVFTTRRYRK
jgi:DNA polymerase